ncbi:MAG: glycosyltransferase [bacterium]|nr:glycosyltransferase [bacterium]
MTKSELQIALHDRTALVKKVVGVGAAVRFTHLQMIMAVFILAAVFYTVVFEANGWLTVGRAFVALSTTMYLVMWIYSIIVVTISTNDAVIEVTDEDVQNSTRDRWPYLSVMVAIYNEAAMVPYLVANMKQLEYPDWDHQVIFVVEERDRETIDALLAQMLPSNFSIVIRPHKHPSKKTKPGAIMYAIRDANALDPKSQLFVIYDAEDNPPSDQLKKAVIAYERVRKQHPHVRCVQGMLAFANSKENWLARLFSLDYANHFRLMLPGLAKAGLLAPLGGTTNFIDTQVIKDLGYDEANVTEDLDLAVKMWLAGIGTRVFSSTTMEEAVTHPRPWIRQRSRWIKGAMQTAAVYARHPLFILRMKGLKGLLSIFITLGGSIFSPLISPIFWGLTAIYALTGAEFVQQLYPGALFHLASISFFFGNFTFVYFVLLAAMHTKQYSNVFFAVLAPFYWVLMSVAAYVAAQEFFSPKLHMWQKTEHKGAASTKKVEELAA